MNICSFSQSSFQHRLGNIYWILIIYTLNIIINLRITRHNICVPRLLLKDSLRLKMQVNRINNILLILEISQLFNLCVLIKLHVVVNVSLLDNAVEHFVFDVFVLNIWNKDILTECETHIWQVHYHHCYFFFTDLLVVPDVKNLEYVFILICTRWPAQLMQGLNEIFECYVVWLGTIDVSHEFVKSVTPKTWNWTKLNKNIPVYASLRFWS